MKKPQKVMSLATHMVSNENLATHMVSNENLAQLRIKMRESSWRIIPLSEMVMTSV